MSELRTILCAIIGLSSSWALAQDIAGVRANRSETLVGQPVEVTVDIVKQRSSGFYCGFGLSMGDGTTRDVRVSETDVPFRFTHAYTQSGNFPITVEGKTLIRGLRTATACSGSSRSTAVVVRTEDAAVRAAEEAKAAVARAVAERQAAEERAAAETQAAAAARALADKAAVERAAAESRAAAQRQAAARANAERAAAEAKALEQRRGAARAKSEANAAAAERANAERAAAEPKAAANRATEGKAAPPGSKPPAVVETAPAATDKAQAASETPPPKKQPVKAKSAMDL